MSVLAFSHFAAQSSALAPAYVAPLVRVPVGGSVMMAPADSLSSNFVCSGRLCFGADWGPRQEEHGQWQPGYWVVLDDDDKSEVPIALNQIGPGLQAGDGCLVELDRMKGTLQLKAGPLVELEERSHAAVRRLQAAMKPLGTMAVIVAVAAILASRSPPPPDRSAWSDVSASSAVLSRCIVTMVRRAGLSTAACRAASKVRNCC